MSDQNTISNESDNEVVANPSGEENSSSQTGQPSSQEQHQPPEGSPRFNQIYGKMKQGERENSELVKMNQKLLEKVESLEGNFNQFQTQSRQEKHAAELADIERKMDEAVSQGDMDAYTQAKKDLNEKLSSQDNVSQSNNYQPNVVQQTQDVDPAFQAFQQYNPWYGTNNEMTQMALRIDSEMKNDPNWSTKNNAEFLAELSRRTIESSNLSNNPYNNGLPVVNGIQGDAGSQPVSQDPVAQRVQGLNQAQKNIAIKLFPEASADDAYKRYAKHL